MVAQANSWSTTTISRLLHPCEFHLLRWETEFTPCTGITAVSKQERRAFGRRGVMIAPWQSRMKTAQAKLDQGLVVDTGLSFNLSGSCAQGTRARVLRSNDDVAMPVFFLDVEGAFQGTPTPYDTPDLARDTLIFGAAVEEFLRAAGATSREFVWGADWQTVPALVRLRGSHHTVLTLHNEFDAWLAHEAAEHGGSLYPSLQGRETALRIGLKQADVVTTVNRGYARGLRTEPIHTQVMAAHLQDLMSRVVPVENANFTPLSQHDADLAKLLAADLDLGLRSIDGSRRQARRSLPEAISSRIGDRVLVVAMGRRVAQKLHEVVIEGTREVLSRNPDLPLFLVLATVPGESEAIDEPRLARIEALAKEFPRNVLATNGRIAYYETLMHAADYNAMASLYEPHGGAFEGSVVPIVRLIDGLARQVNALEPAGRAASINALWHNPWDLPSGLGFREPGTATEVADLRALLTGRAEPDNPTFRAMVSAFADALQTAVAIRRDRPHVYGRLVLGALQAQTGRDWLIQLGGILSLVEQARIRRPLA